MLASGPGTVGLMTATAVGAVPGKMGVVAAMAWRWARMAQQITRWTTRRWLRSCQGSVPGVAHFPCSDSGTCVSQPTMPLSMVANKGSPDACAPPLQGARCGRASRRRPWTISPRQRSRWTFHVTCDSFIAVRRCMHSLVI